GRAYRFGMRAHLVQFDIAWEDPAENFRRVDKLVGGADIDEGDLVVLPEMFDTGFSLNTDVTADRDGATAKYIAGLADDLGCLVQGGRTVRTCFAEHCRPARNHATVFGPEGRLLAEYAKVHPFTFSGEDAKFDGGDGVVTYAWAGPAGTLTVCPAVCYDLRFPELFRLGMLAGADVFAFGANWPAARLGHWRALAIARAIENQGYVLGVNRVGEDPNVAYAGGSIAVDPMGEVVGELRDVEGVLSVAVDPGAIRDWRERFSAWRDVRLIGERALGSGQ
ncbi:MAG: nitrilase-related carbon-nitrogen hydrolase, partial [Planctomycetota bacterium]